MISVMTELQPAPESFFTIRSFDAARSAGAIAVEHNIDVIAGLDEFLKAEGERGLPAPIEEVDFVHFWTGGHSPASWDTHYDKADMHTLYLPGTELAQPTHGADGTTKADIVRRGTQIVEVQTNDYTQPLAGALARALIVPKPEDAAINAGPKAWGSQTKRALSWRGILDAFTPGFSNSGNPKLEAEAQARFADAIVLRKR